MELRELHWVWIETEARAGNLDPLAAELDKPECGPIPETLYALLADLARGKPPKKKPGPKVTDERRQAAESLYLGLRINGKPALWSADEVARQFDLESRAAVYTLIARVLTLGDKLAEQRR